MYFVKIQELLSVGFFYIYIAPTSENSSCTAGLTANYTLIII